MCYQNFAHKLSRHAKRYHQMLHDLHYMSTALALTRPAHYLSAKLHNPG